MGGILVFGSSNADMVFRLPAMPQKGETVRCDEYSNAPGGKGANQACACAKLGAKTTFLSAVGCDAFSGMIMNSLSSVGVDITRMLNVSDVPTGFAAISVDSTGENSIIVVPGANSLCTEEYVNSNQTILEEAEICLVQLELPLSSVISFVRQAKKLNKTVIFNPAPASQDIPEDVYKSLDYFTPNETEIEQITGIGADSEEGIIDAAKSLLGKGVKNVIVTVGNRGAILINNDTIVHYPAFEVNSVDSTAAGDTFNAGLAVALLEGKTIDDAIGFASAAAAISVTRMGAQPSVPSREEVDEFIRIRMNTYGGKQ